jgi:hypothetical protein
VNTASDSEFGSEISDTDSPPVCNKPHKEDEHHQDCYKKCPKNSEAMSTLCRNTQTRLGYPLESWKFLSKGNVAARIALEDDMVYNTCFKETTAPPRILSPFFSNERQAEEEFSMLIPPCLLECNDVITSGNLISTSRSSPATPGDHSITNVILLSKPYKNDLVSLRNVIHALNKIKKGELTDIPDIRICGSGGAPMASDTFALNLNKVSNDDAVYLAPAPQEVAKSKQNVTMMELTKRQAIVAICLDINQFTPFVDGSLIDHSSNQNDDHCLFLGYFYFYSFEYRAYTDQELKTYTDANQPYLSRMTKQKRDDFLSYSRFREEPHFTFTLKPVFASSSQITQVC